MYSNWGNEMKRDGEIKQKELSDNLWWLSYNFIEEEKIIKKWK
jgi:hypothetical protein